MKHLFYSSGIKFRFNYLAFNKTQIKIQFLFNNLNFYDGLFQFKLVNFFKVYVFSFNMIKIKFWEFFFLDKTANEATVIAFFFLFIYRELYKCGLINVKNFYNL